MKTAYKHTAAEMKESTFLVRDEPGQGKKNEGQKITHLTLFSMIISGSIENIMSLMST